MDITVIKILIVCATLIALAAIVCDFWVEKKTVDTSKRLWPNKIIKIHRNYIAGFLGFGIIMLLTAQYGGTGKELYEYLSFGSTITSLVLSILAIFVTVRSSMDLNKQFGTINKVSKQIDDTLRNLQKAEAKIGESSSTISSQVDFIVGEIEKRINRRIDENEKKISSLFNENYSSSAIQGEDRSSDIPIYNEGFISRTSTIGLLALYACMLSCKYDKSFMVSDFYDEERDVAYTYGYLISLQSARIVLFKKLSFLKTVLCKKSSFKQDEIDREIKKRITSLKTQKARGKFLKIINSIIDFFGEDHLEIEEEKEEKE